MYCIQFYALIFLSKAYIVSILKISCYDRLSYLSRHKLLVHEDSLSFASPHEPPFVTSGVHKSVYHPTFKIM